MFTPNEPDILSRYLLKVKIGTRESQLYVSGIRGGGFELTAFEAQLFQHMLLSPIFCAAYDTILSIVDPQNQVRKRLYLMLSILETSPDHANLFLGVHGRWACIRIACVGASKYIFYLLLGSLLYGLQLSKYRLCH
ncbi:MAG: hypothetical protein HRU41_38600 [Saprospiraceae bacterium]|nr:hypothetical protein [Saprospiraceae bacterium]